MKPAAYRLKQWRDFASSMPADERRHLRDTQRRRWLRAILERRAQELRQKKAREDALRRAEQFRAALEQRMRDAGAVIAEPVRH